MLGLGSPSLLPTRTLCKILDSCKQLTLAQGTGEEDPSGMVTIITGLPLDNPSVLSGPMQVGRGARPEVCGMGTRHQSRCPPQTLYTVASPSPSPLPHPSTSSCSSGVRLSPSISPHPHSIGSPAGRCTCQCGHQECSGLLQAVEGDWLRLAPGPCSGADSRSLLPTLGSHPTTRRLGTHTGRQPSCTPAAGRAHARREGGAPTAKMGTAGQ